MPCSRSWERFYRESADGHRCVVTRGSSVDRIRSELCVSRGLRIPSQPNREPTPRGIAAIRPHLVKQRSRLFVNLFRERISTFGRSPVELALGIERPIEQYAHAVSEHLQSPLSQSFRVTLDRVIYPVGQAFLVVRAKEARKL